MRQTARKLDVELGKIVNRNAGLLNTLPVTRDLLSDPHPRIHVSNLFKGESDPI